MSAGQVAVPRIWEKVIIDPDRQFKPGDGLAAWVRALAAIPVSDCARDGLNRAFLVIEVQVESTGVV